MQEHAALRHCRGVLFHCVQGTTTLGKGLMTRNDQFTKLTGDVNKQQSLL